MITKEKLIEILVKRYRGCEMNGPKCSDNHYKDHPERWCKGCLIEALANIGPK